MTGQSLIEWSCKSLKKIFESCAMSKNCLSKRCDWIRIKDSVKNSDRVC